MFLMPSGVNVASDDTKLTKTAFGVDLYVSFNNTEGLVVRLGKHNSVLKVQANVKADLDIRGLPPKVVSTIKVDGDPEDTDFSSTITEI
jgi:hypothetical protein